MNSEIFDTETIKRAVRQSGLLLFGPAGPAELTGELVVRLVEAIADEFSVAPDGPAKTARALRLFGRRGASMIPFLNLGSVGMRAMAQRSST